MIQMKKIFVAASVAVLTAAIVLLVLARASERSTASAQNPRDPAAARSSDNSPQPPHRARTLPLLATSDAGGETPAAPVAASSDAPTSAAIEHTHPGFNDAFRAAVDENADLLHAERRCLLELPGDVNDVSFTTIQTFTKTGATTASLTDVSVQTGIPNIERYTACIRAAILATSPSVQLPDTDMQPEFQVKDEGRWSLDPNLTAERVDATLAELAERLASTDVGTPMHATIQLQMEFFDCVKSRGVAHRRECLAQ